MTNNAKPQPIHATITSEGVMVSFEDGKSQLFPFRELSAAALAAADEMLIQSGAAGWLPRVDRAEEDALWASFIPA